MSPRTPEEILQWASEPDIELEFERVLAMTPEEVRASLASRGHDLKKLEAQARALFGLPKMKRRGFIVPGVAIGAPVAATIAIAVAQMASVAPRGVQMMAASAPPMSQPEALRKEALEACDASQWRLCLDKLDEARALDPDGDALAPIQQVRARAARALADPR